MTTLPTHFVRTENGTATLVTIQEGLAEINPLQMDRRLKRTIRNMSSGRTGTDVEFYTGRKIKWVHASPEQVAEMTPAPEAETISGAPDGYRIVEANGKKYVVTPVLPQVPRTEGRAWWREYAAVEYWTLRNGRMYGATRTALENAKAGSVGAAVWAAASR